MQVLQMAEEDEISVGTSATTPAHRPGAAVDLVSRNGSVVEEFTPSTAIGKVLGNFALPIGLWGVALLLAGRAVLPNYLSGLKVHGPYLVLLSGLLLSLAFRRGRAFFVLFSFALAYFAFVIFLKHENAGFTPETVYAAICVFVPFNIAAFTLFRERGVLNAPGLRRLSLPLIEVGAIAAVLLSGAVGFTDALYRPLFESASLAGIHIPQLGILCTIAAVVIAVVCAVTGGSVIDAALAAAAASFALACNGLPSPGAFTWFCTMAALIVSFAVLQDSRRMAFYDELTGLPGRRALNERLESLDGAFTLAMVDIDHFKVFNDTWGHDVGDQVLKLVAARLQRVGGGGTAYRYGGEEFAILFAGRRRTSVIQHLDSMRKSIEDYKVMLRDIGRPQHATPGNAAPVVAAANRWISVTVSIGVAERSGRAQTPDRVLEASDKALYRAKAEGRNRVVSQ